MKGQFEIKIIDLHWIKNADDPTDLCAHGEVYLRVGEEILSNEQAGDWTLSAAALSLMRTIKMDYKKGDFGSQLIPCCGFFMIADDKEESVNIIGCPNGIDWTILHHDGTIEHLTDNGAKGIINVKDYKTAVFGFADQVGQFYWDRQRKSLPGDEFGKEG